MSKDADIDGLAAEFVLGSLPPAEHAMVKQQLQADQALARAVAEWQRRLGPLSLREPGIEPEPRSLERLLAEIARQAVAGQTAGNVVTVRRTLQRNWAAASLVAATIALAMTGAAFWQYPALNRPGAALPLVAVLAKGDTSTADEPSGTASPVFLATIDPAGTALTVRQSSGRRPAAERSYAVWLLPDGGTATFIGLLAKTEPVTRLPWPLPPAAGGATATLIITSEGVVGTVPAGPILSSGRFEPIAR